MRKFIISTLLISAFAGISVFAAPTTAQPVQSNESYVFSYPTNTESEQWQFKTEGNVQYRRHRYFDASSRTWGNWGNWTQYRTLS